jgi:alanine racemase
MVDYTRRNVRRGGYKYGSAYKGRKPKMKITMGKVFRTKRGILGCYKYVNGKRVGFVRKYRR